MVKTRIQKCVAILKREGPMSFLRKLAVFGVNVARETFVLRPSVPRAIAAVRAFASDDPVRLFTFASGLYMGVIQPMQVQEEATRFLAFVKERRPRVIVEIGTAHGGMLFLFSRIAPSDATLVSIDLPEGRFGGGYPAWKIPLFQSFPRGAQSLHLIRGDSHSPAVLNRLRGILGNRRIDLLFIDGDHTYNGVKSDFESYRGLVGTGGMIAFHDIVPGPEENAGDVAEFWKEVKPSFTTKEFVRNWNQGGAGIGVLLRPAGAEQ